MEIQNTQILAILFLLLIMSCNKEAEISNSIDESLQVYIDLFFEEAESRSISLTKNLDAFLVDEIEGNPSACGQGNSPSFNGKFKKPTLFIDKDCWETYNDVAKEQLIFHELGHALLNRLHIDAALANNYSKSLMCAGNGFVCSNFPDYGFCSDYRTYYIDELFDENTPAPEWATRNWIFKKNIFSDLKNEISQDWLKFSNCSNTDLALSIDSLSVDRPSPFSLKIVSSCNNATTIRKKIVINNYLPNTAVKLKCDIVAQNVAGPGMNISLFTKAKNGAEDNNGFTSFKRSSPDSAITGNKHFANYELQVECVGTQLDTLFLSFQMQKNTTGTFLIGNLDIELWE